ncbi:MAG: lytic transglycosylase [Porticoccaceae bacterium]|nr:lytic transglycosylase [Porticoccaceae bacterium]
MRIPLLLAAVLLLYVTGCAQQTRLSGADDPKTGASPQKQTNPVIFGARIPQTDTAPLPSEIDADDLWGAVIDGMSFSQQVPEKRVQRYLDWYQDNDVYFENTLARADIYMPYVVEQIKENDLPMELALLPFIESGYNPFAQSHSDAVGLWQIIPGTGEGLGLRQDGWYEGRRDIVDSTEAAINYLSHLNERFDGDWLLTLAAYNAGPGAVARAIEQNREAGKPTDFWSLPLNKQARNYVPKLIALSKVLSSPEDYDIDREPLPSKPGFDIVKVDRPIDLTRVAELSDISAEQLYQLNPGFTRWTTPPDGPGRLLIPTEQANEFLDKLAETPLAPWRPTENYVVKQGDTLSTIAARHQMNLQELVELNGLETSLLQIGQTIRIPRPYTRAVSTDAADNAATYTVQQGDSLWQIAQRHGISVDQLRQLNGLAKGALIRPRQQLIVAGQTDQKGRIFYTVAPGDSLYDIAQRFKVSVTDIVAWNELKQQRLIQPGQNLILFPIR